MAIMAIWDVVVSLMTNRSSLLLGTTLGVWIFSSAPEPDILSSLKINFFSKLELCFHLQCLVGH